MKLARTLLFLKRRAYPWILPKGISSQKSWGWSSKREKNYGFSYISILHVYWSEAYEALAALGKGREDDFAIPLMTDSVIYPQSERMKSNEIYWMIKRSWRYIRAI
jgi:hypothetical protein